MALSKFHSLAVVVAAQRLGVSKEDLWGMIPPVLAPDAIRCFGLARSITHFEIGDNGVANGICFPSDLGKINENTDFASMCETGGIYHQVAIGDVTSLRQFDEMNAGLAPLERIFIRLHLEQDKCYDSYIRGVINCFNRGITGEFFFGNDSYNARTVRTLISQIEEQEFRYLSSLYEDERKKFHHDNNNPDNPYVSMDNFKDHFLEPILTHAYASTMAKKTLSFVKIDNDSTIPTPLSSDKQLSEMREMVDEMIHLSENAINYYMYITTGSVG